MLEATFHSWGPSEESGVTASHDTPSDHRATQSILKLGVQAGSGLAPSRQGGAGAPPAGGLPRPGPVLGRQSSVQPPRAPSFSASAPQVKQHN